MRVPGLPSSDACRSISPELNSPASRTERLELVHTKGFTISSLDSLIVDPVGFGGFTTVLREQFPELRVFLEECQQRALSARADVWKRP